MRSGVSKALTRAHVGRARRVRVSQRTQWRLINLYPPFLGIGLRVYDWTQDWTEVKVKLLLTPVNRNTHGTAFGGSIGAMTDGFHAMLLIGQLGPGYDVWDSEAHVKYLSPGAGTVYATYRVSEEAAAEVKAAADAGEKVRRWFDADLTLRDGTVVAQARRQVYVRRKPDRKTPDLVAENSGG
ncbi:PaaI family thioesterase [Dermacoccaceae bacterium W4C1]